MFEAHPQPCPCPDLAKGVQRQCNVAGCPRALTDRLAFALLLSCWNCIAAAYCMIAVDSPTSNYQQGVQGPCTPFLGLCKPETIALTLSQYKKSRFLAGFWPGQGGGQAVKRFCFERLESTATVQ